MMMLSMTAICGAATDARNLWGNSASVLVGDFLLGQAFRMMVAAGSLPALDILSARGDCRRRGDAIGGNE